MTELEQLRKEINELCERIAVLEKRSHAGAISEFEEALKKCKQQYAYQQYRDSLPGTPPQQQSIGIWGLCLFLPRHITYPYSIALCDLI